MQTFNANNLLKYQIGKQTDVALADGGEATTASDFFSLTEFEVQNAPEPMAVEDANGNRTTNSDFVISEKTYPFSFAGTCEVDKIGAWIYYATGEVTSVEDGSTGAFTHTFALRNNVILPPFTLFYAFDGEDNVSSSNRAGYKRLKNCHITSLTVNVTDTEATFSGEGLAIEEDSVVNLSSTVAVPTTVTSTSFEFQADGLIRVTMDTLDLSTVTNGDVLVVPDAATDLANASNRGSFIIVNVNDTSDFVDIINPNRTDNTDDETSVTLADGTIEVVVAPVYPDAVGYLLRRHSIVKDAVNTAGLAAATENGLRNFSFEINNNSGEIREGIRTPNPLAIFGKNITATVTFTQLIDTTSGAKAITYRADTGVKRAWRFDMEDTSILLGTSLTDSPKLQMTVDEAMGIATRTNLHSNDETIYDWTINVTDEQGIDIVLQNEVTSYGS